MLKKIVFLFITTFLLASCSAFPPYEFDPEKDFTYLTFETVDQESGEDVPWSFMDLTVSRCLAEWMGEIDLTAGEATVKVSTLRPFHGSFTVYYDDRKGERYLSFLPKEDRDYKLVYTDKVDQFELKLLSAEKGSDKFNRSEPILFGMDYFRRCQAREEALSWMPSAQ